MAIATARDLTHGPLVAVASSEEHIPLRHRPALVRLHPLQAAHLVVEELEPKAGNDAAERRAQFAIDAALLVRVVDKSDGVFIAQCRRRERW
jgi:hypothetical protein